MRSRVALGVECAAVVAPKSHDPFAPFASGNASADPQEEEARRELAQSMPEGLRVDVPSCFPEVTGWKATRANKARLGFLTNSASVLRACLKPTETIRYVCLAREQVWWEMFGAGQWSMLLNCSVLVATNERIVLVHSDGKGRPSNYVNQIPLTAIRTIKGWLARVTINTQNTSRRFNVGYGDRDNLKRVLPQQDTMVSGNAEYLCAACFAPSAEHIERCPSCDTHFKSPKTAAMRSLLLPGLGTWYVGNKGFAGLQLARGIILWLIMIGLFAGAISSSRHDGELLGLVLFFGVLLAFTHGMDALISRASARKGLIANDLRLGR